MAEQEASGTVAEEARIDEDILQVLQDMANRLRVHAIRTLCASGFRHPTLCSSASEIMSVLLFYIMRYKLTDPENPNNDRFILSKRLSFVNVATGWLGQGLGVACGMAYTGRYFDKASYRVFCLIGDGESSEGSVWEAMAFASHYSLDNLVAIFDVNHLCHGGTLPLEHCVDFFQKRCEAFGWSTFVVDGRDVEALCHVFQQAAQVKSKPTAVVAKTFRGHGMPHVEDAENWHERPMPKERVETIIKLIESQIQTKKKLNPKPPVEDSPQINITDIEMTSPPDYNVGDMIATRKACGLALAKLGRANDRVVVLDGDSKNSTFSEIFKKEHPEHFIECSSEQNMVSVALGCATRGRMVTFLCTFAAFLTRAFDQIRMGAISQTSINLIGSHCGVSIGEDSPSQMALEDLAMFRTVPNCTIFYPSDAISTEHAVFLAANTKGMCYIRISRPETAVIYTPDEIFEIGRAKVVRNSVNDRLTVVGAGVTLHEALAAADDLSKQEDISIRVIDLFTVKPLDAATVISNAKATGGQIITVEDHSSEGGIGEAVCAAVSMVPDILVHQLAVPGVPRSEKPNEPLSMFGISARQIIVAVKCILMN
ncbi:PREDICTED: transketolase-like protein 1 isoform X1 [Lipotes vexillifer]|uniref:transketolase n=1 Tax=Lipotes vexillifer TaxID=118797 RepID=A0A340WUZ8_LIPVE|nr:PREDICTED: transketolase-like protein 1 isoform X1 [Lipotes vexillifer]